ncbi:Histidine kinase [Lentibacillus sp. JNUCC-1]|uniref:AraC family transcriptional regulator n=1 Tax=Lentibacillus sp. JNUCC-1 TaxID=2654513 RepID=UPI0012E85EA2|nr:AraC family transcriptional regulator [Lentibacillus sp. JNUCC-1]MUV37270.1 Histidine kinase [Lentibacillus sp. JNUCC-1]
MKTLIKRLRSQLFLKYTLSYLFVFIVPFALMSVFLYHNSIADLRDQAKDSIQNKAQQTERYTTERFKELDQIAARIANDYHLTPYSVNHDYYSKEAITQLKNYKDNSAILKNIYLYYRGDDNIFSSEGSYHLNTLLENVTPFSQWAMKDFKKKIRTTTNETFLLDHTLISIHPIPTGNPNPYGAVVYTLQESTVTQSLESILNDFQGNAYLLDATNDVILSSQQDENINTGLLNKAIQKKNAEQKLKYKGKTYFISTVASEYNDWSVVSIINMKEFDKVFLMQKLLFASLLVLLLISGFIIAIFLGNRQYKPIHKLISKMNYKDPSEKSLSKNEFTLLDDAISEIYEQNENLSSAMMMQKPYAREQILLKLLKGNVNLEQDYEELFKILNISMYKGAYIVAIVQLPALGDYDRDQLSLQEELIMYLETTEISGIKIHAVDSLENALALIISTSYSLESTVQKRKEIITVINENIYETFTLSPNMSAGLPYQDLRLLNRSYIEALAAMNTHLQHSTDQVEAGVIAFYQDRDVNETKEISYPHEELTKLTQSIRQGNHEVANEALENIFASVHQSSIQMNYMKAVYFDIVNTIVKTIIDLGIAEEVTDIEQVVNFSNPRELKKDLHNMIDQVCRIVVTKKSNFNEQLVVKMTDYIHNNFKAYDMSLEKLAAEFKLSVPYLSRFIKEQFGSTFSNYVFSLRLEEVKKQLLSSNQLIKDIITDVGYRDVSNFTREFKKIEGMTPGQYRKMHSK